MPPGLVRSFKRFLAAEFGFDQQPSKTEDDDEKENDLKRPLNPERPSTRSVSDQGAAPARLTISMR
jgi:hypothetical protein